MPALPDWDALDHALDHALSLDEPSRGAFLATLDGATRAALGPLLATALRNDTPLDQPLSLLEGPGDSAARAGQPLAAGARVGPYEIEALVGEGGMGRVFRAHRADGTFRQTVAVKVVRATLALAGADVAARLRRERAVLAALDHPGIARLLDGGTTEDGVPYLVTEFVDGTPLTAWADAHALDVSARVRLLVDVARAVAHAHRRLVVHRDLKPSNVLVAERDGAPRPVVLDFGIAKLLGEATDGVPGDGPEPLLTQAGLRLFTPAYAAPELYDPVGVVTTASDIYGLGALLYELLTGRRPHEGASLTAPPATEVRRPSHAVLLPGTAADGPTAQRARLLAGDLDTICLKALHPDPARRYASAAALADDLERYLSGHPVAARPDTLAYVASRFVRRNVAASLATVAALVMLVSSLGVTLSLLRSERAAHTEAEAARAHATEAATLLAGLFQNATPRPDGQPATLRQALDEGVADIRALESREMRAYLLGVIGVTYVKLSEPSRADSLLAESLALYGDDASDSTVSRLRIARASTRDAFGDFPGALALARRAYADQQATSSASPLTVRALTMIGRSYLQMNRPAEGLRYTERAVALARQSGYREPLLSALSLYGHALLATGRVDEAVRTQQEAAQRAEALYGDSDDLVLTGFWGLLSEALVAAHRYAEAEAVLRRSRAVHVRDLGPSVSLSYTLASLGGIKRQQRQPAAAAALLDSALAMGRPTLPPRHPDLARWLAQLAEAHNAQRQPHKAEAAAREGLVRAHDASLGPDDEARLRLWAQLGLALQQQGRRSEARPLLERVQQAAARTPAPLDAATTTAVRDALAAP